MYEDMDRDQLCEALSYFESKTEEYDEKISELESLARRHKSEKENVKRRRQEEIERAKDEATRDVLSEIIDVLDDFERALNAIDESNQIYSGVEMIKSKLEDKLEKKGLEKIDTEGEIDPELHKAVEQVRSEKPDKHVVEVKKPGYKKGDYVIREAHVAVSTGNEQEESGD